MADKMNMGVRRVLVSFMGLGVVFLIIILVNVLLSFANVRWDVTEEKIYSLSKGSKKILERITVPVTISFFFNRSSRNLPTDLKLYVRRVEEFLAEYEHAARGKVRVQKYDPRPDSDEEDWAQKYGLRPLQLGTGDRMYCGLVFTAADQEDIIPFLDPAREELLEYDITRSIYRVQSPKKKIIGIISTLPVFGEATSRQWQGASAPWLFVSELKKSYDVRQIGLFADKIDPDIDLLIIVHPKNLNQKLQYAIDQFVLLIQPSKSSLKTLFRAWGIRMDASKVVADLDQPTTLRSRGNRVVQSPLWISARDDTFASKEIITSKLEKMLFPVAGALQKSPQSPYSFTPLVRTSKNAALFDSFKTSLGPEAIRREFRAAPEPFTLIAQVRGKFKTAFPAGPPYKKNSLAKQIKEAKKESTIIIVADADMLADRFYVQKRRVLGFVLTKMFNDNLNFVANACEMLTGGDELISIRSRGRFERPFTTVIALQRRAQQRWLAKEQELARQVEATNKKLRELEQQKDPSQKLIISPEQEREIARFREKKQRADIECLGRTLKAINIFAMPFCVSMAGLLLAWHRHRRMKRP
ncbi:MAG: Gldg family protein [Deltaproteobacteria bacterium]|nr:Gldg family protein [Deltaproteobacteria bacterium]